VNPIETGQFILRVSKDLPETEKRKLKKKKNIKDKTKKKRMKISSKARLCGAAPIQVLDARRMCMGQAGTRGKG
jgi:hypothetical protein